MHLQATSCRFTKTLLSNEIIRFQLRFTRHRARRVLKNFCRAVSLSVLAYLICHKKLLYIFRKKRTTAKCHSRGKNVWDHFHHINDKSLIVSHFPQRGSYFLRRKSSPETRGWKSVCIIFRSRFWRTIVPVNRCIRFAQNYGYTSCKIT